jgi:hypothetical protein
MRIAIIDADLISNRKHRFPNLACMKISGYHKKLGDDVHLSLTYDQLHDYDQVYLSKVFTETPVPSEVLQLDNIQFGGTGFFYDKAPPLPVEIEHSMPDYHLYDTFVQSRLEAGESKASLSYYTKYSIGFTTRGCFRGCEFCVNKNCKTSDRHSPPLEFIDPDRPYICLLDDNVLACREWKTIFAELNATGKRFQFKQGMDERLLTDEKCEVIFRSNWIGDYIFAFDNIDDRKIIEKNLSLIRKHSNKIVKFYVFCAFNRWSPNIYPEWFYASDIFDTFTRIKILMRYRALPYIMRYSDWKTFPDPYRGIYVTLARWCNQPSHFKKMSFREFAKSKPSSLRYIKEFEDKHPKIANLFFDLKWGDQCAEQ